MLNVECANPSRDKPYLLNEIIDIQLSNKALFLVGLIKFEQSVYLEVLWLLWGQILIRQAIGWRTDK